MRYYREASSVYSPCGRILYATEQSLFIHQPLGPQGLNPALTLARAEQRPSLENNKMISLHKKYRV